VEGEQWYFCEKFGVKGSNSGERYSSVRNMEPDLG
jgi:hypothetical protein